MLSDDTLLTTRGLEVPVTTRSRVEIWRYSNEKMRDLDQRLRQYIRTGRPSIDWQPSPDEAALRAITERLNQWSRGAEADKSWQADPLIATLPADLRRLAPGDELAQDRFLPGDSRFLQQAIWARDVANWVTADASDDLHAATLLFDWTVRNVHLETRKDESDPFSSPPGIAYQPWQALLHGQGTAEERAWVFAQLCRQKELDVVMLSFGPAGLPDELRAWLPALLLDGKLYLFDPKLGLPIPGPNRQSVATLEEAATDDSVLRQLDISPTQRYPLESSDLTNAVAYVSALPGELSRRMRLVEANLAGNQKARLIADPSSVADALSEIARVEKVQLWPFPWQTLAKQQSMDEATRDRAVRNFSLYAWQPRLWKARVSHFQGTFSGGDDAVESYRKLRRLSNEEINAASKRPEEKMLIMLAKKHASYWLGVVSFELENYEQSIDYLRRRTIDVAPKGLWAESARYNLARAHEALGQTEEAISLYEQDESAQQYGNRLRAHWLKTVTDAPADVPADKPSSPSPAEASP